MKCVVNETIKEIIVIFTKKNPRKHMDKFDEIVRNIFNLQDMKLLLLQPIIDFTRQQMNDINEWDRTYNSIKLQTTSMRLRLQRVTEFAKTRLSNFHSLTHIRINLSKIRLCRKKLKYSILSDKG